MKIALAFTLLFWFSGVHTKVLIIPDELLDELPEAWTTASALMTTSTTEAAPLVAFMPITTARKAFQSPAATVASPTHHGRPKRFC